MMLVGKEMGKCTSGALPIAQAGRGVRQTPAGTILGTGHGCNHGVVWRGFYELDSHALPIHMLKVCRREVSADAD